MKREFLKELQVPEEAIEKIMAEYGRDIGRFKEDAQSIQAKDAELEALKSQLADANQQIGEFKSMDIDGVRQAAESWKTKYEQAERNNAARLEQMRFDYALENALSEAGAKNTKAVKALLDLEGTRLEGNGIPGLAEQLERLREEDAYLFETDTRQPRIVGPAAGTGIQKLSGVEQAFYGMNPAIRLEE